MTRGRPGTTKHGLEKLALPLVVLALIVVVYAPSLSGGFVWDDHYVLEHNHLLSQPWKLLTSYVNTGTSLPDCCNYRPLMMMTHALAQMMWPGPAVERLFSLVLHLLAVCMIAGILQSFGVSRELAWFGALVFGVHAGASEAAIWPNARSDLLSSVLIIAAWFAFRRRWDLCAGILLGMAPFTKESALVVPGVAALWMLGDKRKSLKLLVPTMLGVLLYLGIREVLHKQIPFGAADTSLLSHLGASAYRLLQLALSPSSADALPLFEAMPLMGVVALGTGIILALLGYGRPALAGICAACLTLIPNGAASAHNGLIGDRYLYLPLASLVIGATYAIARSKRWHRIAWSIPLVLAWTTFLRAGDWKDDESVFGLSLARNPDNPYAAYHVAYDVHTRKGDCETAIVLYKKAAPYIRSAGNNLQACLLTLGRYQEAADMGNTVASADPNNPNPAANTARSEAALGNMDSATSWAAEAVRRAPNRARFHVLLGTLYGKSGRYLEAEAEFREALSMEPGLLEAVAGLRLALEKQEEKAPADQLEKAPGSAEESREFR